MNIVDRIDQYDQEHCWQYDIRIKNKMEDIKLSGLSEKEINSLTIPDFTFNAYGEFCDSEGTIIQNNKKEIWKEAKAFIERHEWLGKMSLYPTHIFTATYKGILAGVVIMDMPNCFSKLLGENTRKIERLISRGACISWSPKNLASALIMYSIKYMVKYTRFRAFTAYSDAEAKEIGTIYQACNFIYLGKESGTKNQYRVPGTDRWISDRSFRARSYYRKYAKELNIDWDKNWQDGDKIVWDKMPKKIAALIKQYAKDYQSKCDVRVVGAKHKYLYILGTNKKETKLLYNRFVEANPDKVGLPYPKNRGE
jgi:hypothetical protein